MAVGKQQLDRFTHIWYQVAPSRDYMDLAARLNDLLPGDFDKKTIVVAAEAEVAGDAVTITRAATGRSAVIAFIRASPGRTFMGMALPDKVMPYKKRFGSMPGDVFRVSFPT
ncbi:aminotransferase class III-fold pyridoxal phosphate-dependent enzyme [Jannaschia rubra]|uniref:aminotransferase class III-fold pyridoxal phosphate-dependent enzyme n=1 Tax=Jannaschia rubra TaxID=282197 RepID=UPI0031E9FA80